MGKRGKVEAENEGINELPNSKGLKKKKHHRREERMSEGTVECVIQFLISYIVRGLLLIVD
jgi:hypothetical protein